jgi:dihydroorotase
MSQRLFIHNVRLIDPDSGYDGHGALLAEDGKIAAMGPKLSAPAGAGSIDGGGKILCPGFVDMRVFTGEPGSEHRETLASASEAAAAGGVTTMVVMPDTDPVIDDMALVDFIKRRAEATAKVRVLPAGALTKGLKGEVMTEIGLMASAGAVMFTDPTAAVKNTLVMRRCLSYAANFGALVSVHAEDPWLSAGAANEGEYAARLGLPGNPAISEAIALQRDLALAAVTGARLHIGQISTAESVDLIKRARRQGVRVTCAASAHHLALNERDIEQYKTFAKVSPPLRSEQDRMALVEGVREGVIDAIVSSHDPQAPETKRQPFAQAAPGAIGLETLLPAALTLHHSGGIELGAVLARLTCGPASILQLEQGRLAAGAPADLALIDPDAPVKVDPAAFRSHTKNSPFKGRLLMGRVLRTIVGGKTVFAADMR